MSKTDLRTAALARRDALTSAQREAASRAVAARAFPAAIANETIVAGYAPIRSEIDPRPLMQALAARGARLALPCVTARDAPLVFRAWAPAQLLTPGAFGIAEPSTGAPALTPDIILVPLAAFDRAGHRIGYGAGFYDRTLAALRTTRSVMAIGLAFAVQESASIPAAPHDVRLDYVLTENETIDFRS